VDKDGQKYVYVVSQGKAKQAAVEIGLEGDLNIEITKGIKEGMW